MTLYTYSQGDRLLEPLRYNYTAYAGKEFLVAYFDSRAGCAAKSFDAEEVRRLTRDAGSSELSLSLRQLLAGEQPEASFDSYVRRYEVTKKIFASYGPDGKPSPGADFHEMSAYVLLALGCGLRYRQTGSLRYLNCMLKVGDLLVSRFALLGSQEQALARLALALERDVVQELMGQQGVQL